MECVKLRNVLGDYVDDTAPDVELISVVLTIGEVFGDAGFQKLPEVVAHWINDSEYKQSFIGPLWFRTILYVDSIHIQNKQKDIQKMHHAAHKMDAPSVLIPLKLDQLLEVFRIKYLELIFRINAHLH